jgi:DNA polymerase II small subunit/DNA polymerase delta subunit B
MLTETENSEGDVEQTRIVMLPKFSQTGTIVLINTSTLEVTPVRFRGLGHSSEVEGTEDEQMLDSSQ